MISIIIPAYNCESTLKRCLDSILSQQYSGFEVVLVDDGSADGTASICDEYAATDVRVRVFHKLNGGVSSARNVGIDNAAGEWITFVDSDDEMAEDALTRIAAAIGRQNPEHPALILGNMTIVHPGETGFALYGPGLSSLGQLYHQGLWGAVWNKTFSHKIIEEHHIRFDEDIHLSEDLLFTAEYCSHVNGLDYTVEPCYIQYEMQKYGIKYKSFNTLDKNLRLYAKMKDVNKECSDTLVDGLVMDLLKGMKSGQITDTRSAIADLKNTVGKNIIHAAGRKKALIRMLSKARCLCTWEAVLKVYSTLNIL